MFIPSSSLQKDVFFLCNFSMLRTPFPDTIKFSLQHTLKNKNSSSLSFSRDPAMVKMSSNGGSSEFMRCCISGSMVFGWRWSGILKQIENERLKLKKMDYDLKKEKLFYKN